MDYHFLLQGIFPNPGIKLVSPELQTDSLLWSHLGSPVTQFIHLQNGQSSICNTKFGWGSIVAESRGAKEPLHEGEGGEWKSWLKTQHLKKTKIMASGPWLHSKLKGKMWKQWQISSSLALKSLRWWLQSWKLDDTCFLAGKLWQT